MGPLTRTAAPSAPLSSNCGRTLAIDYGRLRIGLALSDELGLTAQPVKALERTNRREDLCRLRELVKANRVTTILVGLPLHLSGHRSEMAEEAAQFASRIHKLLGLPVKLRDERLTSWEAEQMSKEPKNKRRISVDSLAAAVILREYLEEQHARDDSRKRAAR